MISKRKASDNNEARKCNTAKTRTTEEEMKIAHRVVKKPYLEKDRIPVSKSTPMHNRPSTSYECDHGSGSVHFTIADSKSTISVQPHVYKQPTINNYFQPVARATTSEPSVEIRSCCKTYDIKGHTLCAVLKAKLQAFYTTLTLPKVAWIDESAELSLEEYFVRLQLTNSERFIEIEEVFHEINNKKPRRILIEGQPGYGKTTLATKLAFDWATNKEYIDFKLLFFIPLRELRQRTIDDAIMKIGERCGYREQERINIKHILARHENEILFVLDGLDELSFKDRNETLKVLYNQMYDDLTVLTLCRTGLFKLTKEEGDELFGQTNNSRKFWNKRLSVLGIESIDSKKEFLKKFLPEQNVNDIIDRLSSQLELFNSPLYLMMLPIIMENDKNIGHFSTRTDLYKKLFNSIVRHSCVKRGILDSDSEFDLFNSNSSPERIREQMIRFGELCVQKILQNDLTFDPNDLTNEIYQLGLLTNHKQVTLFASKIHYEAFHLSIMEFAAAFALSIHLKINKPALIRYSLEQILNLFTVKGGTSLILPFLAGLLGSDLDRLLYKIAPFSDLFCCDPQLTLQLIAECSTIDISNSKYLRKFIPSHITLFHQNVMIISNFAAAKKLLKYGCDCGKIKRVTTSGRIPPELYPANFTTRLEIIMHVGFFGLLTMYSRASPNLQEIFLQPIPQLGTLNERLSFVASQKPESCALIIHDYRSALSRSLKTIMKEETCDQIKFRYIRIEIRTEIEKQFVISLLENDQVEYLALTGTFDYLMNLSEVFSAAARSNCLTSFSCARINVDLYDITNGGTKNYNFLELDCCVLTCKQPISQKNCFKHFRLLRPFNIAPITEMEPCQFGCSTTELDNLIEKCPTWVGFNSVKYLKIFIDTIAYRRIFVSAWTNLQILHLQFTTRLNPVEMMADSIQKSSIVKLVVEIHNESLTLNLFRHMNCLWTNGNNSHLKTITFVSLAKDNSTKEEVLELIEGLKCSHWDRVILDSYYSYLLPAIDIRKHLLNFNVRHFKHQFYDRFLGDSCEFYDFTSPFRSLSVLSLSKRPV